MKFQLENAAAALLLDPGLGKTSITLGSITELKRVGMFDRALLIAPRRVCHSVWPQEVEKWEQFNGLRVSIMHGSPKKREAALEADADIYLINPEGLPWLLQDGGRFRALNPCTLVVDEMSKFKDSQTQRFKLLKPYLPKFARRWGLTGSPMPNGYLDLFGQMYLLDLGRSLGAYITHYRNRYFFPSGFGGYTWKLKEQVTVDDRSYLPADETTPYKNRIEVSGEKAIQERVRPLALRMKAEDYLKMPERITNVKRVYLDDETRKLYDTMEEEMIVTLGGNDIVARSASSASVKCAQIANGGIYREEIVGTEFAPRIKKIPSRIHDLKTEALEEIVDEASSPVIVGYEFQHDVERILATFPDAPVLGGGTSDKKALEIERKWNRKELPLVVAHPASMGHGLNLQTGGNHIVWYGIPWDYELYDQFIRRVWRQGAAFPNVFIHHLVAVDTVDDAKMLSLDRKSKDQNKFMDSLKDYLRKRQSRKR